LWQTVKAAYDICSDCIIAAGESATDTKSILKSKYYHTYSTYDIFAAQLMEQIQKGSSQIPKAPVTPSQYSTRLDVELQWFAPSTTGREDLAQCITNAAKCMQQPIISSYKQKWFDENWQMSWRESMNALKQSRLSSAENDKRAT